MEIVIAVRGFVEIAEIVVFVLVSVGVTLTMSAALLVRLRLVRLVNVALTVFAALLVGVFGAEISDTAMGGAAIESVVETIELRELSLSVENTISAAVFETCNVVHNALINLVIKGSGIDAVSLKANIINFLVEIILFEIEFGLTSLKVIRGANLRLSSTSIISSDSEITIVILLRDHNFGSSEKTIRGKCATSRAIDANISLSSSEADLISVAEISLSETAVESTLVAVNTLDTAESEKSGTVTTGTETLRTSVGVANISLNAAASAKKTVLATSESVVSKLTGLAVGRTTVENNISGGTTTAMTDVTLSAVAVIRGGTDDMASMATSGGSTTVAVGKAQLAVTTVVKVKKSWLSLEAAGELTTITIAEVRLGLLLFVGATLVMGADVTVESTGV